MSGVDDKVSSCDSSPPYSHSEFSDNGQSSLTESNASTPASLVGSGSSAAALYSMSFTGSCDSLSSVAGHLSEGEVCTATGKDVQKKVPQARTSTSNACPPQTTSTAPATVKFDAYLSSSSLHTSMESTADEAPRKLMPSAIANPKHDFAELPKHQPLTRMAPSSQTVSKESRARKVQDIPVAFSTSSTAEEDLSPWQQWVVRKAKEQRRSLEKQREEEMSARRQAGQKEKVTAKQNERAEQAWEEWCETKSRQDRVKQHQIERREMEARHQKEMQERRTQEKAQSAFEAWQAEKRREKLEKKAAEEVKKKEKEAEDLAKRQHASEAFDVWRKTADQRLSKERRKEMFDVLRAPLSPTFENPVPWQPIVSKKSKKTSAHRRIVLQGTQR